jgi:hypothetical protein
MAESGDPNENAMAELVFRTLKEDFRLRGFFLFQQQAPLSNELFMLTITFGRTPQSAISHPTRRIDGQARSH